MAALLLLGSFAFVHLMALPVFADEGDQLRWIWRVIEAGEWLQPLGDGKPLEAWPMVPLVRLGFHPLIAARALHVLAGMIGAVLTYRLALQLNDRGTAFVSGALFAICPFVVYLQRFALSDMFMCVPAYGCSQASSSSSNRRPGGIPSWSPSACRWRR
jgi:4-amino-4-deoxy-L-arabinose transferase-like glycosyltransferase